MILTSKIRRIACLALTAVMSSTFIAGNILAFSDDKALAGTTTETNVSFENVTGNFNLSSVVLNNLSNQVMTNTTTNASSSASNTVATVIVSLSEKSLIERTGDDETVSEYASSYIGGKAIKRIASSQSTFLSNLSAQGVDYTVVDTYNTVLNGVAIKVNTKYLSTIKSISGVTGAYVSETYAYPETTTESSSGSAVSNGNNVYATGIYDSSEQIAAGYDGSGMTVAILDTGLDYTHEAFSNMPATYSFDEDYIQDVIDNNTLNAVTLSGGNLSASDLYINAKVPFAYDYADKDTDVYPSYSQHGTHVAGIVAGEASSYKDKDGNLVDEEFLGVAPQAQLVICKVFTDDFDSKDLGGAVTEDIVAALEDCVLLNVDVINMSLGTTAGFSTKYIDGDDEGTLLANVYASIKSKGISLICAASNDFSSGYGSAFGTNLASNPESGTVGSPSTYTGAMSVASINGQLSPFMLSNGTTSIFYEESNNQYSQENCFADEMLDDLGLTSSTFKYVIIPNTGRAADYSTRIQNLLKNKAEGEKVIAVIKRGTNTFKEKVQIAARYGADAVIIYNNVAGTIKMSLGDLEDPIPAVSVTMDAGKSLISEATSSVGYIEVNKNYNAGPFMNGYSSWGSTPDLKLKPDVTAHGGEITSTVSGGYSEMSGTSMASPNLAGFVALVRSYLKEKFPEYNSVQLTQLVNQIVMSTATTVYDENGLAYSPRKQGSGLATLANAFSTNAYLYTLETDTYGAEDNRPKAELGEDENKTGEYTIRFYVSNFGDSALTFKTKSLFMTETISSDGLSVAEKAYMLNDIASVWKINGTTMAEGESFTVATNSVATIEVTLKLSDAEKKYIDDNFVNGMYVEGFLQLVSETSGQCDLNLPFMGFYGDWDSAPLLDYDAYEVAEFDQDTSYTDETRPKESVWATQAYATYYNEKYTVPIGSFVYLQNEDDDSVEKIYATEEHNSISCYNEYYDEDDLTNYMTTTTIKALYAGLLRNAELVTYELYDVYTGEIIKSDSVYNLHKAYANGGSSVPSQVLLELDPVELGLVDNGKYRLDFKFFRTTDDKDEYDRTGVMNEDNTFSMTFYADYQAPVLQNASVRYYTYKENNKEKQKVYLDLDVYDNHYAQSVLLCYSDYNKEGKLELDLATEYVTPVYNAVRNGTTTVSIEITDFYEKYSDRLYVQLDDYALNHNVYQLSFTNANAQLQAASFAVAGSTDITIGTNETYKVSLNYYDSNKQLLTSSTAQLANYKWSVINPTVASVKNGEIFGKKAGTTWVTVTDGKNPTSIKVTVTASTTKLATPSISFGTIETAGEGLKKASGSVKVYAGETFTLSIESDPWYYPVENLKLKWSSTDESVATVTQDGVVTTLDKKGTTTIKAVIVNDNGLETSYSTSVLLSVQDPFTVSSYTLTSYHGSGGVVTIPADMNIMYIGEEAFKDNDNITTIIIPKTVTQIQAKAFKNCTALENVYFIDTEKQEPANAELALILNSAFEGCTKLKKFDLSNCKTITIDKLAFKNCTSLEEVVDMDKIGTMNYGVFLNCTSLKSADITGLHVSGANVFDGCTSLASVTTAYYTDIGEYMFSGCTALTSIDINSPVVASGAFYGCTSLKSVTFGGDTSGSPYCTSYSIGAGAFNGCVSLDSITFVGDNVVTSIGDGAFTGCTSLKTFPLTNTTTSLGNNVFNGTDLSFNISGTGYTLDSDALYLGTTLVLAPSTVPAGFTIKSGTTAIGAYAFSGCTFEGTLTIPSTVTEIGEGAFYGSNLSSIDLGNITSIEDYTFADTKLTSITIGNKITYIGSSAFAGCTDLATVTFESGSALAKIGDSAFDGCSALETIALPDGVSNMGTRVFANCTSLTSATLPSVKTLGGYTFYNTPALVEVTFGANAETTGTYTFYGLSYTLSGGEISATSVSKLTSVTLGNATTAIGEGTFAYCNKLTSLNLKNVTYIGDGAFAFCTSLTASADWLKDVTYIGTGAFMNTAITALNLQKAETIENSAFANTGDGASISSLNMPAVKYIGANAFYGNTLTTVTIPASTTYVGSNAFGNSTSLTAISVDSGNTTYFAEDGVLYRNITSTTYELVSYPASRYAGYTNSARTYTIKEGTVSVLAYAFANIKSGTIDRIVIPYSVKTLGHSAFYSSGISTYYFEAISAPELQTEIDSFAQESMGGRYTFYYNNYSEYFVYYYGQIDGLYNPSLSKPTTLTLYFPSNGTGYDNFVYSNYFGTKYVIGELMDDDTRGLKESIEGFVSAETVSSWNSLTINAENKSMIESFSAEVKDAHRVYNNISSSVQLEYLGEENIQKLFAIESALKSVKSRFGIKVSATSLTVASDSTHRTTYVEGEQFDMTGLKLTVTYDDYSTEEADMSNISFAISYPDGLSTLNRYVILEGYGVEVQVAVTVTEGDTDGTTDGTDSTTTSKKKKGCKSEISTDATIGVAVVTTIVAVAYLALRKKLFSDNFNNKKGQ